MITVLWARFAYLNPGVPQLMRALACSGEAHVRVVDVTTLTPDEVARTAHSSTAIVIDQSIYNAATWVSDVFSSYYVYDLKPRAHYEEVLDRLLDSPVAVLFATYFDLHDPKNFSLLDRIGGRADAISWLYEHEPIAIGDVPERYRDAWLTADYDPMRCWQRARELFPIRVDLPFALGEDELQPTSDVAIWPACVAGAPYLTRQIARRSLRNAGVRLAPTPTISLTLRAVNRILPHILSARRASEFAIAVAQRVQRATVSRSTVNFVCGGAVAFPVRKFFEIPGMARAMVAMPCTGFADYGFRDEENVVVATPETAGAITRRLLADEGRRERIARAGWTLVHERHSAKRRAAELVESARRLATGTLKGARFVDGEFCFL